MTDQVVEVIHERYAFDAQRAILVNLSDLDKSFEEQAEQKVLDRLFLSR